MNEQERQALREKHRLDGCSDAQCFDYGCEGEHGICFECRAIHPCDVIKLLDAYDKLAERARELECQRWGTEFVMTCYQGTDIEEMRESLGMVLDNIDPSTGKPLDVEKWVVYE